MFPAAASPAAPAPRLVVADGPMERVLYADAPAPVAAQAVALVLPELEGKLTGNSVRVPTPDVSMAILNLTLEKAVEREALNDFLRQASLYGDLHKQLDYIDSPEVVSTDFVGNRHAGIVDGRATITSGDRVVLYVWYDNEFGYSCQVIRVVEEMAGAHPASFPRD